AGAAGSSSGCPRPRRGCPDGSGPARSPRSASCCSSIGRADLRHLREVLLVVGVVLFAVLVATNDPAAILASIVQLSWRLAIVLCFPVALVMVFDTLGWQFAFLRDAVAFRTLLEVRLAGEAFNLVTPTAALGGEAVKAWLLRGRVPLDASVPSVIVAKTTITIAQGLFLVLGIALAWTSTLPGSPLLYGMLWLLAIETVALAGFVIAQTRGMLAWGGRLLAQLGLDPGHADALGRIDDVLARFYRTAPWRLALSLTFHLAAWLLGSIESWLVLRFLGSPLSLTTWTVLLLISAGAAGAGLPTVTHDGRPYVELKRVAAAHGDAELEASPAGTRARLRVPGHVVTFTRNWAQILVNDTPLVLDAPVRVKRGVWLVPESFVGRVLPGLSPGVAVVTAQAGPGAPAPGVTLAELRFRSYPSFTRVVVETSGLLTYRIERQGPKEARIRLIGLAARAQAAEIRDGSVDEVRLERAGVDALLRVVFEGTAGTTRT